MLLTEVLLYQAAKRLAPLNNALSAEMKTALKDRSSYDAHRKAEVDGIRAALDRYALSCSGQVVCDLGCNDGAITSSYLSLGARKVIGVDIDAGAIARARECGPHQGLEFRVSQAARLPVADDELDLIIAYDVFEHVAAPLPLLRDCYRALTPGGHMLIRTWGWYHPFAPHLWSTMPVPWAHVFVSERTLLRACRRVYQSAWYVPTMHDFDLNGRRLSDRYMGSSIPRDYLNHYLLRDFRRAFAKSGFTWTMHADGFSARGARWTRAFLRVPFLQEFFTAAVWVVLTKAQGGQQSACDGHLT